MMKTLSTFIGLGLLALSGCASLDPMPRSASVLGLDGLACVGQVGTPPPGLMEVMDPDLLKTALGSAEQGKLCAAKVFVVQKPVAVYRVWDARYSYSLYGRWWSFDNPKEATVDPAATRQNYREKNAICQAWSALDRVSQCTIKVGSRIVVGPGQSAACGSGDPTVFAPSAVNQVYIANDSRAGQLWVENCSDAAPWP